jgi:hypothetical protein
MFQASNIPWLSNHMLCAIAFKPIESHQSFSNLNVWELILEIIEVASFTTTNFIIAIQLTLWFT